MTLTTCIETPTSLYIGITFKGLSPNTSTNPTTTNFNLHPTHPRLYHQHPSLHNKLPLLISNPLLPSRVLQTTNSCNTTHSHLHHAPPHTLRLRPAGDPPPCRPRPQHPYESSLARVLPRGTAPRRQDDRHVPGVGPRIRRRGEFGYRFLGK